MIGLKSMDYIMKYVIRNKSAQVVLKDITKKKGPFWAFLLRHGQFSLAKFLYNPGDLLLDDTITYPGLRGSIVQRRIKLMMLVKEECQRRKQEQARSC